MKIDIVCVGKIKEKFFVSAIDEYTKRLSRYCSLKIIEVPDEKTIDGASLAIEEQVKATEGERILKNIPESAYVITLEIEGKKLSSEQMAAKLSKLFVEGRSHIVFVIGGSLGLSDVVKKRSDYALSFSDMTFPHQLMRVILLEQIYRCFRINAGEPYHK